MAICGLVSGLLMAFRADEHTVENITGIIMALGSVVAYCIGEGLADAARADAVETHPPEDKMEDDLR